MSSRLTLHVLGTELSAGSAFQALSLSVPPAWPWERSLIRGRGIALGPAHEGSTSWTLVTVVPGTLKLAFLSRVTITPGEFTPFPCPL